ncbi:MAG: non-homologous end-joining DNA ligase [Terrimicrobiaceae bacterium]|nr:non-homologous end-joining DNA ligase [Terrimicrobiaceae bacterium]
MSLKEYTRKRNFRKTAEPRGSKATKAGYRFVIQKHDASRLHYDFRLEIGGTLKSWAVPKGVPVEHGEKRLAVQVEDHPVSYVDFEGTIPAGQYGGGTVMVWDAGTFEPLSKTPAKDLDAGKLHFTLHGRKLKGEWHLVRLRDDGQWLLIRGGESMKPVSRRMDDTSVASGKSMKQLSASDRVWNSKTAKKTKSAPIPGFVEPMKARLAAHAPSDKGWIYEIKFDGFRALALRGSDEARLLSRNEKDLGAKFPEILEAVARLRVTDAILDGEIVALDENGVSSFQRLQAYELGEERPPLYFYVFDLLRLNGKDLLTRPLSERKAMLEKLVPSGSGLIRYSAPLGDKAAPLLERAREIGLEGLIGKRKDSAYEPGRRSGAWIKLKLLREQEFVIGGHTDPEGSRKYFGALLVGVHRNKTLVFTGKVGTGFNYALLRVLHGRFAKIAREDCPFSNLPEPRSSGRGKSLTASEMKRCHWVEPAMVCQVRFSEWTRDNHLRQPVFLGLREDKDAREVVREEA